MNFFKELASMAPGVAITMNIMEKNGSMTVSIVPNTLQGVKALVGRGTPEELDTSFLDQIRQPMEATTLAVCNADEYQKSLAKAAPSKPAVKDKKVNAPEPDAEEADEEQSEETETKPKKEKKPKAEKPATPPPAPEKPGLKQLLVFD
jgi:PRTRC genetic system protein E